MSRKREPFFGPNAKFFALQFVIAFVLWHFFAWIGVGELGGWIVRSLIDLVAG